MSKKSKYHSQVKSAADGSENSLLARKAALDILLAVKKEGQSLSALNHLSEGLVPRDAAFAKLLSYGVLRFYDQLKALVNPLIPKPLKPKDLDIELSLLLALYQIEHTRVPDYAVVDETVKLVRKSKKQWASKLVNGVLRNYLRQQEELQKKLSTQDARFAHPDWIVKAIKKDWPDHWQHILTANNQQAPMTLRVNLQKVTRDDFIQELKQASELECGAIKGLDAALVLEQACDVTQLPGYDDGWFSVQDAGAQFAAMLMKPQAGDTILDACAAPGGKTAHMMELQPDCDMTAMDISESRLERVEENCQRLGFDAKLIAADVSALDDWWQGEVYDRILLDVPCSATGVIRRHPDIKHLRREQDIEELVAIQRRILNQSWTILRPGGVCYMQPVRYLDVRISNR